MNRREMLINALKAGALMSLTAGLNPIKIPAYEKDLFFVEELAGNPLRFPPVITGGNMTLGVSNVTVWPNQSTEVIAVNGLYPGPTVKIQRGSTFTADFHNNLTEASTIHWHGLMAPELMDGHPKDAVQPGNSYTYTFPVNQHAGTFFYHSHAHMNTAKQVYKGFAGFFIIEDPNELQFNLPQGDFDVPLLIQDRRAADIPQFAYSPGMQEMTDGYLGDVVLVNGTPEAYFEVSKTLYRFRLVNGSNARIYKIALSDNHPFHIIATDGGLKDMPAQATSFYLSPAERVDILVDFSSYTLGQNVTLKTLQFTAPGSGNYRQGVEMNILRFDVTGSLSSGGQIPSSLIPVTYYNPNETTNVRTFTLTQTSGTGMHRINGLTFEMMRVDEQIPLYALEEWKIVNASPGLHTMHAHGMLFQVYSRNGNTNLAPNDKGWKDTVLVNPAETVRVLAKYNDYKGIYLFHCHNLEHEDDGMMLNFKVIDPIGVKEEQNNVPVEHKLHQNYPNPFNPSTKIKYEIGSREKDSFVKINLFDERGKQIRTLVNRYQKAGIYEIEITASDLSSGVYFCKMETAAFSKTVKMMLVK